MTEHYPSRTCFACRLSIQAGEKSHTLRRVVDGEPRHFRLHTRCVHELSRNKDYSMRWHEGVLSDGYIDRAECSPEWVAWYTHRTKDAVAQRGSPSPSPDAPSDSDGGSDTDD